MSTRGFLVVEVDDDKAYVFVDGDAYAAQVENVVKALLDRNTNGDLFGLSALEKADALVAATEEWREKEYPKTYVIGGRTTTVEYTPWLTVREGLSARELEGMFAGDFKVFTLTGSYDLFEGRRLAVRSPLRWEGTGRRTDSARRR